MNAPTIRKMTERARWKRMAKVWDSWPTDVSEVVLTELGAGEKRKYDLAGEPWKTLPRTWKRRMMNQQNDILQTYGKFASGKYMWSPR